MQIIVMLPNTNSVAEQPYSNNIIVANAPRLMEPKLTKQRRPPQVFQQEYSSA
jgi:hypothetical protein